jgi:hypothetical protein
MYACFVRLASSMGVVKVEGVEGTAQLLGDTENFSPIN